MISKKMEQMVAGSSVVRVMFEEGKRMAKEFGKENICDFSLGNPNVPAPPCVKEALLEILQEENSLELHGYPNNAGFEDVRDTVAQSLNSQHGTTYTNQNVIMTVGAAGGLNVILKTLMNPGDEVVVFVPYFGEYRNYVSNFDGVVVEVPPEPKTLEPDLVAFEKALTPKTKVVIVNSPNNPSGVVYSAETIEKMGQIMAQKEKEFGTEIYLISDECYRELVYDGVELPFIPHYYHNAIVGYSFSKALSLPGERIGYLVIPNAVTDSALVFAAATTANRILGFVNAPTIQQKLIARCINDTADISIYAKNRDVLYQHLIDIGMECIKPQGAFYLFVKTPMADDNEFVALAKEQHIIVSPGSFFGTPGYVRLAYCVEHEVILRSLPKFTALIESIKGK